jgi:hypothetical protein
MRLGRPSRAGCPEKRRALQQGRGPSAHRRPPKRGESRLPGRHARIDRPRRRMAWEHSLARSRAKAYRAPPGRARALSLSGSHENWIWVRFVLGSPLKQPRSHRKQGRSTVRLAVAPERCSPQAPSSPRRFVQPRSGPPRRNRRHLRACCCGRRFLFGAEGGVSLSTGTVIRLASGPRA